ncbi:DUF7860 family protein [Halopiger djelfimassiliensis]|uniref:DUF7860 family protein n=1 Tax=Halopiger djelfimassiliensis TaxID=1293047 RepID=UPI000677E5E6|nr:hypothetical protein [Halopiger djelfimassiliensis]
MGHSMGLDYGRWTKNGFFLGLSMVIIGAALAGLGTYVFGSIPAWERTLAIDMMLVGIAVGFSAVFGFGILLPLTE